MQIKAEEISSIIKEKIRASINRSMSARPGP